ncbi:MAG: choice-of-anchor L domain-containing protein [Actinomycetota bacterium]
MNGSSHTLRPLRRALPRVAIATVVVGVSLALGPTAGATPGALSVTTLGETLTPTMLAQDLAGDGVTVSNVSYAGAQGAAGRFDDTGSPPDLIVGFDGGVILSSGGAALIPGPNDSGSTTVINGTPGDPGLEALLPPGSASTYDASTLTFDFVPNDDAITFRYVFSSEEYNEFVGQPVDDVFGFFINGSNCATVGGDRISINAINGGNPFGTTNPDDGVMASHPELFRNNDPFDPGPPTINVEADGLTTILTCTAPVTANETNTLKLSISDVGDSQFDSNVLIEAGSLTTAPDNTPPVAQDQDVSTPQNTSVDIDLAATDADAGDTLTYAVVTPPANGQLSGSAPSLSYTPDASFMGADSFTFVANDGTADSNTATVSITVSPPGTQFSMTIDTSQGGILLIDPEGAADLGTSAKIKIPRQPGPPTEVTVTATLFGVPGEVDETCGGNVCIGQGIEWSVSDPDAIKRMRVKFIEAPSLTHGGSAQDAVAYKDGVPVADCATGVPDRLKEKPCIVWRWTSRAGLWQITFLVDGNDPKGRI